MGVSCAVGTLPPKERSWSKRRRYSELFGTQRDLPLITCIVMYRGGYLSVETCVQVLYDPVDEQ